MEQLTYLLFLKMTDERTKSPYNQPSAVHRVLMDKVFPWQATVVTSREFLKTIGARDIK